MSRKYDISVICANPKPSVLGTIVNKKLITVVLVNKGVINIQFLQETSVSKILSVIVCTLCKIHLVQE